jgi:DNA-binding PadR family transcriptional regulator
LESGTSVGTSQRGQYRDRQGRARLARRIADVANHPGSPPNEGVDAIDIRYLFSLLMKYPFLALLAGGPAHGYELKQALEQRFGAVLPPLNAGQIYTTLQRLERDGLVCGRDVQGDARNKRVYELTPAGVAALRGWVHAPSPAARPRDEFFLKLVFAGLSGLADPRALIERQRRECFQALRDLESAAARLPDDGAAAAALLVEGVSLHIEADLKWLDLCETKLLMGGG